MLRRIKPAVLCSHLTKLITDEAASLMNRSCELFQMLFTGFSCKNLVQGRVLGIKVYKVFYPDQCDPVTSKGAVFISDFLRGNTGKIVGSGSGLDEFPVDCQRSEFPRFEKFRLAEVIDCAFCNVVILRIEWDRLGGNCLRSDFGCLIIGKGNAGKRCGYNSCCSSCKRTLKKISSGNTGHL